MSDPVRLDIKAFPILAESGPILTQFDNPTTKRSVMEHKKNNLIAQVGSSDCDDMPLVAAKGITRGTTRLLRDMSFEVLTEFKLNSHRRADLTGLDRKGRFVIVEIKSSLADFRADTKWHHYLPHCDFFYFAVAGDFPVEFLPRSEGLIIADAFHGTVIRPADERKINGNRRRTQILDFARISARRVARWCDPGERAFY